jgi:hypothetical protein
MKKCLLAASFVLALVLTSCGPSQNDAIKYNDQLIAIQKALVPFHQGFIDQIDGHNTDSLKLMQEMFVAKSKEALENCQKLQPFAEKRDYLDAAIEYFKTMNDLANNESKMIMETMVKDSTQVTEEDMNKITEYAGKFDSEYERIMKKVQDAQNAFAVEWKFQLVEKE